MILEVIKESLSRFKTTPKPLSSVLFVTPGYDYSGFSSDEPYIVVLSPHYYWCKKATRDFKSTFQAKKFAPSFFDFDASYEYDVYKQEEGFFFVAFNKDDILTRLKEQGIDVAQIDKIYLAQSFFRNFQRAIILNDTEALARVSGVVVVVDQSLCSELYQSSELMNLSCEQKVPLKIAGLGQQSTLSLQKPLILLASALFLWLASSWINLAMTKSELLAKQEALKVEYKLPATSFQLQSMVKNLEKVEKKQQFIRESLNSLNMKNASIGTSVTSIEMSTKDMKILFSKPLEKGLLSTLQKALKKDAKEVRLSQENQQTLLRVQR